LKRGRVRAIAEGGSARSSLGSLHSAALTVIALAALVGVAGCASRRPPAVDFSETIKQYKAGDYDRVRETWTRHAKLVRDIGTVIEVWATYKSADFRQAYVEQYAEVYGLGADDRTQLRTAQIEAARTNFDFHVVAQSTEWKWNELEQKDSVWKITLIDGEGHELAPSQITFEKLPELYLMRFFPVRTDFSRIYTVRFSRDAASKFAGAATGRLTLRFAGPVGASELTWESEGARQAKR
jgi:hypothetical protein